MNDKLYVLTMLANPFRWNSRYRNHQSFVHGISSNTNAVLYTGEVVYGDGQFTITSQYNPRHLQLRSESIIWHQRNVYNLLMNRLPEDAKYIAWVDTDVLFTRQDWAEETVKKLKTYDVVQMFSHAQNLGIDYEPLGCSRPGYFYQYKTEGEIYGGINFYVRDLPQEKNAHPGLAWAATKEALLQLGGLIDWTIVGSADFHMAAALLGKLGSVIEHRGYTKGYKDRCEAWEIKAKSLNKNVGYVDGLVCHYWHGDVSGRKYRNYQDILIDYKFDPNVDLIKDAQGLNVLVGKPVLQKAIWNYMSSRQED